MPTRSVHVLIRDQSLKRQLTSRLGATFTVAEPGESHAHGDIALVIATETSPAECEDLRRTGLHPVVLTAVWSDQSRRLYTEAGAAGYLLMDFNMEPLFHGLRGLVERQDCALPFESR